MATTDKTDLSPEKALAEAKAVFGSDLAASFDKVLREFEIPVENIKAPEVDAATVQNFDSLCTILTPVEYRGHALKHDGHTGPMMFLGGMDFTESDDFAESGYIGYYRWNAWHPDLGRVVMTYSAGKEDDDMVRFLNTMEPGNVYTVAMFRTRKGFRVFRPIPAQPREQ